MKIDCTRYGDFDTAPGYKLTSSEKRRSTGLSKSGLLWRGGVIRESQRCGLISRGREGGARFWRNKKLQREFRLLDWRICCGVPIYWWRTLLCLLFNLTLDERSYYFSHHCAQIRSRMYVAYFFKERYTPFEFYQTMA